MSAADGLYGACRRIPARSRDGTHFFLTVNNFCIFLRVCVRACASCGVYLRLCARVCMYVCVCSFAASERESGRLETGRAAVSQPDTEGCKLN